MTVEDFFKRNKWVQEYLDEGLNIREVIDLKINPCELIEQLQKGVGLPMGHRLLVAYFFEEHGREVGSWDFYSPMTGTYVDPDENPVDDLRTVDGFKQIVWVYAHILEDKTEESGRHYIFMYRVA